MSSLLTTTYNTRLLREGSFRYVRSDVPDRLNPQDLQWLLEHNIQTVIDLRSPEEAAGRPCPLSSHPAFHYRLMTVSTDIAPRRPEDVPQSYLSMVTHRAWEAVRAAQQADTNVLYFCNAGKDRTGVISALLLREMGASRQEVVDNYVLSAENLREMLVQFVANRPELSLSVVTPRPWYMETFLDRLEIQEKQEAALCPKP